MKNPVMQRSMFIAMGQGPMKSNGILSGLEEETEEGYEDRRPDNIEIIANNLRGDIRSMDERYLELAQMVGEAAFDTPEEVLALMQTRLPPAAPQQVPGMPDQGPEMAPPGMPGQEMMPPQGMMPPEMGMPPPSGGGIEGLMAPQMAPGGITEAVEPVQRASGSPPMGETSYAQARASYGGVPRAPAGQNPFLSRLPAAVQLPMQNILQTNAPTSASGRPIPFVDRQGRMFQPVGGTNPRMASRGIPMPSNPTLMRMAGFPGYVAAAGLGATSALMATDRGAGRDYPSVMGLEFGESGGMEEGVPVTPGYSALSGVPAAVDIPPPAAFDPNLGAAIENIPTAPRDIEAESARMFDERLRSGLPFPDLGPDQEALVEAAKKETSENLGEAPPPRAKDLRERVKERMEIYQDLLGGDEEMRKAQALFILAEGALNMAAARGGNTADKIARGLKGVPSALGALGAEKAKQDMAIKTAAISAVEQEMRDEAKYSAALAGQLAKLNFQNADLMTQAKYLHEAHGMGYPRALELARLSKSGMIETDKDTGDVRDRLGKVVFSPVAPLQDGDVGFVPQDAPFVRVGQQRLTAATPKERGDLIAKKRANQALVMDIENLFRSKDFETMYGPLARIQSGATSIIVPFFGETSFTDVQKQQYANNAKQLNLELRRINVVNEGRPSVWDQQQAKGIESDPEAFFNSAEQSFAKLNNFRVRAINEINRIDHQLNPDKVPLKQLDIIPLGTSQDPIQAKDARYMVEFFRLRPSGSLYLAIPDPQDPKKTRTEKVTADQFFSQFPNLRPQ